MSAALPEKVPLQRPDNRRQIVLEVLSRAAFNGEVLVVLFVGFGRSELEL